MNLRNENIVYARDIIYSSNNIYIIMDLCNNGDLRNMLIKSESKLSEWESMKILF